MQAKRLISIFLIFLLAPVIGVGLAVANFNLYAQAMEFPLQQVETAVQNVASELNDLQKNVFFLNQSISEQERQFIEQQRILQELAIKSQEHKQLSEQIYEERILKMLGPPVAIHQSNRVEIKIFKLDELDYRGYMAKIKLFDPSAFKVVLAQDRLGEKETTSQAVARTGAVLGINGGGFFSTIRNNKNFIQPLGNTVIDGKLVDGFYPSIEDIFFCGIQKNGNLIGGIFYNKETLMALKPWQGISFVPILIQNGKPLPLPKKWANTKHPRTVIGEYANGDLLLIVVDGRQSSWSSGVTLERLQVKLVELGVKEGYNLDGGGSSTFVFKGEILNRPSDGKERPVATNIVIMP